MTELRTPRLLLRPWKDADFEPFAAMNADPRVMEHYPSVLTREQSDNFVRERILPQFERRGCGPWAVEVRGVTPFAGYVGLLEHSLEAPFTPCVEVGWRLAFRYWGHGYDTEGARAALTYGFDVVGLDEIVSFTAGVRPSAIPSLSLPGCRTHALEQPYWPQRQTGSPRFRRSSWTPHRPQLGGTTRAATSRAWIKVIPKTSSMRMTIGSIVS